MSKIKKSHFYRWYITHTDTYTHTKCSKDKPNQNKGTESDGRRGISHTAIRGGISQGAALEQRLKCSGGRNQANQILGEGCSRPENRMYQNPEKENKLDIFKE